MLRSLFEVFDVPGLSLDSNTFRVFCSVGVGDLRTHTINRSQAAMASISLYGLANKERIKLSFSVFAEAGSALKGKISGFALMIRNMLELPIQ